MKTFIKNQLIEELYKIFVRSNMTQKDFAYLLGIRQPKLSRIFNFHYQEISIDYLVNYLSLLGKNVKIEIVDWPNHDEVF